MKLGVIGVVVPNIPIWQICLAIVIAALVVAIILLVARSPFKYPYFVHVFDIPPDMQLDMQADIDKLIDGFLLQHYAYTLEQQRERVHDWKLRCEARIHNSLLRNYRWSQYERCIDDDHAFRFIFGGEERVFSIDEFEARGKMLTKAALDAGVIEG